MIGYERKNITIMRFTNRYVVSSIISTDRKKEEREREKWNEDSKIFHVVNLNWLAYL